VRLRLLVGAATLGSVLLVVAAPPASAHGVGERADLPLPLWLFTYGAAGVLVLSFLVLRTAWPRPRLRSAAVGRALPSLVSRAAGPVIVLGRLVSLVLLAVVVSAAFAGDESPRLNVAPIGVYVAFWVGVQVLSALVGDVWRVLDPIDTLAAGAARLRRGIGAGRERGAPDQPGRGPAWTAAVLLFSFVWLELAYYDPSNPRALGRWLVIYLVVTLAGAAAWGRGWLRRGEGFAVLFGLLARLAPFFRDEDGRVRVRPPFSGLAAVPPAPGVAAVILVVLGSTTFDGLSRTRLWLDVTGTRTGWALTAINTVGLVWTVGLVTLAFVAATRVAARIGQRDPMETALAFAGSLVPIALAYTVAHYFSLLVFEGQSLVALVSDPYGRGWDLFGTATHTVNYQALSPTAIAYVQAGAIVVGHVVGVVAAHDRAVERWPRGVAERTQYAMLAVMIAYTVGGLAILLGG